MPAWGARRTGEDESESLTVLDLDAPELGIRPEDEYAAIPPGPRLVPRRHHDESSAAPLLLLAGLVAFFVLGAWLGGAGSGDESERDADRAPLPVLDQPTGTSLLLFGDAAFALDVDRGTAGLAAAPAFDRVAAEVRQGGLIASGPALGQALAATTEPGGGSSLVSSLDLSDASPTGAPVAIPGRVRAAVRTGLVTDRGNGSLAVVTPDGAVVAELADAHEFLAAAADTVVTRLAACTGADCALTIHDLTTGLTRTLRVERGGTGDERAALSPDGRRLAVVRSDGVETRGVLVDLRLQTVTAFVARGMPGSTGAAPQLAWSADGEWLFVATVRDRLDVVRADGQVYRVDADLPAFVGLISQA